MEREDHEENGEEIRTTAVVIQQHRPHDFVEYIEHGHYHTIGIREDAKTGRARQKDAATLFDGTEEIAKDRAKVEFAQNLLISSVVGQKKQEYQVEKESERERGQKGKIIRYNINKTKGNNQERGSKAEEIKRINRERMAGLKSREIQAAKKEMIEKLEDSKLDRDLLLPEMFSLLSLMSKVYNENPSESKAVDIFQTVYMIVKISESIWAARRINVRFLSQDQLRYLLDVLRRLGFHQNASDLMVALQERNMVPVAELNEMMEENNRPRNTEWILPNKPLNFNEGCERFQMQHCGKVMLKNTEPQYIPDLDFYPDKWQAELCGYIKDNIRVLVVKPLSSGKTFACLYLMKRLAIQNREKKAKKLEDRREKKRDREPREEFKARMVYVAPKDLLIDVLAIMKSMGKVKGGILTRDFRSNEYTCEFLLITPQYFDILLFSPSNEKWLKKLQYVIFDEVQMAFDSYTEPKTKSESNEADAEMKSESNKADAKTKSESNKADAKMKSESNKAYARVVSAVPCPFVCLSATIKNPVAMQNWLKSVHEGQRIELIADGLNQRCSDEDKESKLGVETGGGQGENGEGKQEEKGGGIEKENEKKALVGSSGGNDKLPTDKSPEKDESLPPAENEFCAKDDVLKEQQVTMERWTYTAKFVYVPTENMSFPDIKDGYELDNDREALKKEFPNSFPSLTEGKFDQFQSIHPVSLLTEQHSYDSVKDNIILSPSEADKLIQVMDRHQDLLETPDLIGKLKELSEARYFKGVNMIENQHCLQYQKRLLEFFLAESSPQFKTQVLHDLRTVHWPQKVPLVAVSLYLAKHFINVLAEMKQKKMLPAVCFNNSKGTNKFLFEETVNLLDVMSSYRGNPEDGVEKKNQDSWGDKESSRDKQGILKDHVKEMNERRRRIKNPDKIKTRLEILKKEYKSVINQKRGYSFEGKPLFSEEDKFTEALVKSVIKKEPDMKYLRLLIRGLARGIAVYDSGRSKAVLRLVTSLVRRGTVNVVIATNNMSRGINLPFRSAVFLSTIHIDTETFLQASGRAGRRGYDTIGNVVFVAFDEETIQSVLCTGVQKRRIVSTLDVVTCLRILVMYNQYENKEVVVNVMNSLMRPGVQNMRLPNAERDIKVFWSFALDVMKRLRVVRYDLVPANLTGIVTRCNEIYPGNLILVDLMNCEFMSALVREGGSERDVEDKVMAVLALIFVPLRLRCRKAECSYKGLVPGARLRHCLTGWNRFIERCYETLIQRFIRRDKARRLGFEQQRDSLMISLTHREEREKADNNEYEEEEDEEMEEEKKVKEEDEKVEEEEVKKVKKVKDEKDSYLSTLKSMRSGNRQEIEKEKEEKQDKEEKGGEDEDDPLGEEFDSYALDWLRSPSNVRKLSETHRLNDTKVYSNLCEWRSVLVKLHVAMTVCGVDPAIVKVLKALVARFVDPRTVYR